MTPTKLNLDALREAVYHAWRAYCLAAEAVQQATAAQIEAGDLVVKMGRAWEDLFEARWLLDRATGRDPLARYQGGPLPRDPNFGKLPEEIAEDESYQAVLMSD